MSTENEEYLGDQSTEPNVRRRVSIVWRYFEKLDRFRVRCKLCRHEQNYQGTTGNILRHLKNKHNIDATLKGQKDNYSMTQGQAALITGTDEELHIEESEFEGVPVKTEESTVNISRALRHAKSKVSTYCEDDPYTETSILDNYMDTKLYGHEVVEKSPADRHESSLEKRKYTVEEERVLAEIDYFREKAAYYRMQKNLAALQAKKIKYELDQLG